VHLLVFADFGKADDAHHRLFDREMKAQEFVEPHQDVMHDVPFILGGGGLDDGQCGLLDLPVLVVDFFDAGKVFGIHGASVARNGRIVICESCTAWNETCP
jgi:hypothetical protein